MAMAKKKTATTTTTDVSCDVTLDVPEFDSALLVELLEEADPPEQIGEDHDMLQCFVVGQSSSEAEVAAVGMHDNKCEDCGLDNILSKLESRGGCSMMAVEDPFGSMEMEMEMEMEWYMDGGNLEVGEYGGDQRDCCGFYYSEVAMEQVYIPLWQ